METNTILRVRLILILILIMSYLAHSRGNKCSLLRIRVVVQILYLFSDDHTKTDTNKVLRCRPIIILIIISSSK